MKVSRLLVVVAVLFFGVISSALYSSEGKTDEKKAEKTSEKSKTADPMVVIEKRVSRLAKQLNLTEEQQEKIKVIYKTEYEKNKSIKEDTSLNKTQKKAAQKEVVTERESQFNKALTPEQQAKHTKMLEEAKKKAEERKMKKLQEKEKEKEE
jgi:Spy/CpxP family protein refolding chaperone